MENASKALIIAGAILLSISIIGIGMYIFRMSSETVDGLGIDAEEIAAYNGKFDRYMGTQKGSAVRTLCDAIRNHNLANSDDASKQIELVDGSAAGKTAAPQALIDPSTINSIKSKILAGNTYTVDFGYDTNSGLIIAVGIVKK